MGLSLALLECVMITQRVKIIVGLALFIPFSSSASGKHSIDSIMKQSRGLAAKTEVEAQKSSVRWVHAKELLGKQYRKSIVKKVEGFNSIDDLLYQWTNQELRKPWKHLSGRIANTIIEESEKYGFDPIFLMAVIENESSFNPKAIGTSGEIGLMQITPQTAEWITKKYNLDWKGKNSLKDPITNIRIGSAYLAYLREKFEFQSQLYLAAYNMGSTNVRRALEKQILPKEYPSRVMKRYIRFYTQVQKHVASN